jgi:hypothetical protein
MEPNWLGIVDEGDEGDDAPNPTRREGTFRVFEFSRDASHLPTLLEEIAAWARECAEHQVVDLAVSNADGWATVAVTVWEVSPGDLIKSLTSQGQADMAASIANLVTEHGVREGLRLAGIASR